MDLSINKNMIDKDEYPQTAEIERRCVQMLADLWNAPDEGGAVGCSAIGSSEACMLGGMAALWRWRAKRKAEGKPTDSPELRLRPGPGGVAQVRPLLGRGDPGDPHGPGPVLHGRRADAGPGRREHHHRGPDLRRDLHRRLRAGRRAGRRPRHPGRRHRASTSTSTWTGPRAPSSGRSAPPTWCGTSASPGSSRSRPRATSSAWPRSGWAGCCGATPTTCPTT